jgi:hypothetical protein
MRSQQSRSLFLKAGRSAVSLLLILVFVFSAASQGRRKIEISRVINPAPVAGAYFTKVFRYGGGVVPYGSAEFISPTNAKLTAGQLQLVILDKSKLRNNRTDYDAIGIRWQGKVYQLATQDDLVYPLMKFVQRGKYVAYTIAVAGFSKAYFNESGLVDVGDMSLNGRTFNTYATKEFQAAPHVKFLQQIDLNTKVEALPANVKTMIIKDVKGAKRLSPEARSVISYVNADFHIEYKVFLDSANGKRVIDVGGLPLRYQWATAKGGAIIKDVYVFQFPTRQFDLQDRAVMFFQTAAILRQFHKDNPQEFNRFLLELGAVIRSQ